MTYEVKAEERNVEVNCSERIPDDIAKLLQNAAEERRSVWNTDACRTMFVVNCRNVKVQKALLNEYEFLLDYNW